MKYTKEMLEHVVASSFSLVEAMRKLGLKSLGGASCKHFKNKIDNYNIDRSHFTRYYQSGAPTCKKHWSLKLVKGNVLRSCTLREALIESGRSYECEKCGVGPEWNGKLLIIQIDHVDGDTSNNEPENIRFLCPNCHSQTETHSKVKTLQFKKCVCGKRSRAKRCSECYKAERQNGIPPVEKLRELVWSKPSTEIAKEFGVSDRMIGKWCTKYGLSKPPPGYWTKTKRGCS